MSLKNVLFFLAVSAAFSATGNLMTQTGDMAIGAMLLIAATILSGMALASHVGQQIKISCPGVLVMGSLAAMAILMVTGASQASTNPTIGFALIVMANMVFFPTTSLVMSSDQ